MSQARSRILAAATAIAGGTPFLLPKAGFIQILSWGKSGTPPLQVWTIGEGFGIRSEFRQTGCAANNFRVHEVFLPWFKGTGD